MKPRILIVGRKTLPESYVKAVYGAGGEPELALPSEETAKNGGALKDFLRPFQGILLPGGADVNPRFYGEDAHKETRIAEASLDEGQLAVARFVLREGLPTLAICRGLQVMGVATGVTLYQDLPNQRPSDINHDEKDKPKNHLAHEVVVEDDSFLRRLSGSARFLVNSRHYQAVRENGEAGCIGPFRIVARAPDGIVEGMELASSRFLVAVQWHPENLFLAGDPQAEGLFRGFVEAC